MTESPGAPAAATTTGAVVDPGHRRSWLRTPVTGTSATAVLTVVAVGADYPLFEELSVGTALGVVLLPVWWRAVTRYLDLRVLLGLIGLALLSAVWLTELAKQDHSTSSRMMLSNLLLVAGVATGVGVIAWCRTLMRSPVVATWYGVGMVLGIETGGRFAENPWRFGFSLPLTVLLLALAWSSRRAWWQVAAALALSGMSALNGGRSTSAMILLAAVVALHQATVGRTRTRAGSRVRAVLMIGALGFALYHVGQAVILDGYLGQDAQQRTEAQIALSGSIINGARPESGATRALMGHRPYGYGAGTRPSTEDLMVAKSGMASLGYDPNNGYVERYMFGSGMKLHSTSGDLWALAGIPGLLVACWVLWIVLRGYTTAFTRYAAGALLTYLAVRTVWDLLFSPLYSTATLLVLALGLLAVPRGDTTARGPDGRARPLDAGRAPTTARTPVVGRTPAARRTRPV